MVYSNSPPTENDIEDLRRDLSPTGPDGLFTTDEVDQVIALLDQVRRNAGAA